MLAAGERIYLLIRERQSRAMATRARDPAVRHIHIQLAEAYARRAHDLVPEEDGTMAST